MELGNSGASRKIRSESNAKRDITHQLGFVKEADICRPSEERKTTSVFQSTITHEPKGNTRQVVQP